MSQHFQLIIYMIRLNKFHKFHKFHKFDKSNIFSLGRYYKILSYDHIKKITIIKRQFLNGLDLFLSKCFCTCDQTILNSFSYPCRISVSHIHVAIFLLCIASTSLWYDKILFHNQSLPSLCHSFSVHIQVSKHM